jgi:hypothetical protein
MKKKSKKKEVQESKKLTKLTTEKSVDPADKPLDFGGLPERNIKKNLGC